MTDPARGGAVSGDGSVMYFGIGAQKAGTSWLGTYLTLHPQVAVGPLKEYHYFERIYPTAHPDRLDFRPKGAPKSLYPMLADNAVRWRIAARRGSLPRKALMVTVPTRYKTLVQGQKRGMRAFGDVTPEYGLLTEEGFRGMRAAHPRTKFFFLMRDPVARLWSHMRMDAGKYAHHARDVGDDPLAWLERMPQNYAYWGRSDYGRTMRELEKAVPAEDILYLFFEDLVTEPSVRRVTDFLGLDYAPFSEEKKNTGDGVKMTDAWKWRARELLDPIYRDVHAKFGDAVPASWLAEASASLRA